MLANYRFYPVRIKDAQRVCVYALSKKGTITTINNNEDDIDIYSVSAPPDSLHERCSKLLDILNENITITDKHQAEAVIRICQALFNTYVYDKAKAVKENNIWRVFWLAPKNKMTFGPYYWEIEVDNNNRIKDIQIGRKLISISDDD